jgi:hypothetical protein
VGARFSARPDRPWAHPAFCIMRTGSFPGVSCGRGVTLTTHPLLAQRSWKSRALSLPPLGHDQGCNGVTLPLPLVPEHAGDGTLHEVYFIIRVLLNFSLCILLVHVLNVEIQCSFKEVFREGEKKWRNLLLFVMSL